MKFELIGRSKLPKLTAVERARIDALFESYRPKTVFSKTFTMWERGLKLLAGPRSLQLEIKISLHRFKEVA